MSRTKSRVPLALRSNADALRRVRDTCREASGLVKPPQNRLLAAENAALFLPGML